MPGDTLSLLLARPKHQQYRLFDGRAQDLGPYYVAFGLTDAGPEPEPSPRHARVLNPMDVLQDGLDQYGRWKRSENEAARNAFLRRADWAVAAQSEVAGVRGSYALPWASKTYGSAIGFRSAAAQGEAISLLLRAYQETNREMYLQRALDASIPLSVDVREGGVLWRSGEDVFFEGVAGTVPSHILSSWIFALWGLFECSRIAESPALDQLCQESRATLEKFLPCYDSGHWSYDSLLASPTGLRRVASLRRHHLHVAQLSVLLSMTKNELFSVVAERWRRYGTSFRGYAHACANALPTLMFGEFLTIAGGARSVV